MLTSTLRSVLRIALAACVAPAALVAQSSAADVAQRVASQSIRPGDRVELKFMRDPGLNASVNVNERGEAVFPKLGSIDVDAIAIGALRDTLVKRYSEYLRAPELEVSVWRRIVVLGEVRNADVYFLDASSTVRDAIAKAGGALPTANKGKVTIVRGGERIKAKQWETSESRANDVQSGDQIIVGRQSWLVLNALPLVSTSVIVIGLIRSLR